MYRSGINTHPDRYRESGLLKVSRLRVSPSDGRMPMDFYYPSIFLSSETNKAHSQEAVESLIFMHISGAVFVICYSVDSRQKANIRIRSRNSIDTLERQRRPALN